MNKTRSIYLAAIILLFMLGVAYYSMLGDTAIMDEASHIPAGYSYVTQGDMRINPEHPPLIKDIAGFSVLLASKLTNNPIKFPSTIPAWQANTKDTINAQWDFGFDFLYHEGNPADMIIFAGRLPMLLILLILGIYIFRWAREVWGDKTALITLFLFAFSPTFLAHGRFVTTDVAAAAGFLISSYYFFRWLKMPTKWHLISAAIFFGLAQLTKFSVFLLVPLFAFLAVVWIIVKITKQKHNSEDPQTIPAIPQNTYSAPARLQTPPVKIFESATKIIFKYLGGLIFIFAVAYLFIVIPVYYFNIKNYPAEKQRQSAQCILATYASGPLNLKELQAGSPDWCMQPVQKPLAACTVLSRINRCPADLAVWTSDKSMPVRAFGQYLLGLVMVVQRASGGNTTYFLGQITNTGWTSYFPILYFLKEPLTLHILTLMAIIIFLYYLLKKKPEESNQTQEQKKSPIAKFFLWLGQNFDAFGMFMFVAMYWVVSMRSPLNIGVRHILPTFPFIYALVASQISRWLDRKHPEDNETITHYLKWAVVIILLGWQAASVMSVYPSFLAYFNESIGGPSQGYKYAVDSNLDWGQDLGRLNTWFDQQGINKIYMDYFGGSDVKYILGDKFEPWWGSRNPSDLKPGDWLAVSASFLQGGRGTLAPGFSADSGYYNWLNAYQPKIVIGHSIFVYQIQ